MTDEARIAKCRGKALWTFRHSSLGFPSSFEIRHSSLPAHLSHSPITKSRLPSTAGTSLTMQPGSSSGRILRFTNDGARIFSRGGGVPYRLKIRAPSFVNLSILPELLPGCMVSDVPAVLGSLDFVMGECDR